MKILIFSDLHGSVKNLKSLLYDENDFDYFFFAGDFLGYFPIESDVNSLLTDKRTRIIIGNHDLYFLKLLFPKEFTIFYEEYESQMIPLTEYDSKYGQLESFKNSPFLDNLSYFLGTPLTRMLKINKINFLLCHGSPINPFKDYIYEDSELIDRIFDRYNFDVLILGHTHKPFIIKKENRFIINPGSCTLPRGQFGPSVIICQTDPINFELRELKQQINYRKITPYKVIQID